MLLSLDLKLKSLRQTPRSGPYIGEWNVSVPSNVFDLGVTENLKCNYCIKDQYTLEFFQKKL